MKRHLLLCLAFLVSALSLHAAEGGIVPIVKHGTDAELSAGTETKPRAWSAEQLGTLSSGLILTDLPAWSAGTDYAEDDAVSHNGSSWFAQTNPTTGEEPGVASDWTLIAEKGDTGATGATGSTGATGAAGDSAYVYIAYASDDAGTDFTTTFDSGLDYIAVLTSPTEIASPDAGDFTGLWFNYKGPAGLSILNGSGAPNDANGNNGDLYFRHTGDVYVKAAGTWGSPVFSMADLTTLIVDTLTVTTLNMASLIFEGATADANETTVAVVDPTADRTFTLPDRSGTAAVSGDTFTGDVTGTIDTDGSTALTLSATFKFRSIAIADLGDTSTPSVLTTAETTGTVISNYQTSGADHVFTLPAAHANANVIFAIGDEFQVDIDPPSGTAIYLNGVALATDENIINDNDTLGERIVGYCVNLNGTLRWMFFSSDANWTEATP